ncbi:phosphomevalonate kinase [Bifidobacterium xylocopae]|nr:phosphomevalonate kinase [Bifidobacterium xylocopae]
MSRVAVIKQAQAAGKLYLAGEYAVVEPGHPAVLVAVDRTLTARVSGPGTDRVGGAADTQTGRIESAGHPEACTDWHREEGVLTPDVRPDRPSYLLAAVRTVEELVIERGIAPRSFDLDISSRLDAQSGKKYGLGSSAAVAVATVRALLDFYGLALSPMETYKLAYLATGRAQSLGSGGDLAASLFGGCIRFCSPDRAWVRERVAATSLSRLIEEPWPALSITRLRAFGPDSPLRLLVGWTGSPASTPSLVASVKQRSGDGRRGRYERFLDDSDTCVDALAGALDAGDLGEVRECVAQARTLLTGLSALTDTAIETPALRTLVELALVRGAAAKSSGAGGGDCGIAIVGGQDSRGDESSLDGKLVQETQGAQPSQPFEGASERGSGSVPAQGQAAAVRAAWARAGIEPLDVSVIRPLASLENWAPASAGPGGAAPGADKERA